MSTVEFSEGLFDSIPIDKREIFIKQVIEKAGNKFFVYDCKEFDFEPLIPHKNDQNKSYRLTKAKICKTKAGHIFQVEKEVVFHADLNKKVDIHPDFKFKNSLVFHVDDVWADPRDWYEYCPGCPGVELRIKGSKKFDTEEYEFNKKVYTPKTKNYVKIPETSEPVLVDDSTAEVECKAIHTTNKNFPGSRVESHVYANLHSYKHIENFIDMRVIERQDQLDIPRVYIKAMDFCDHMYKQKQNPVTIVHKSAQHFKIDVEKLDKYYRSRKSTRSGARKFWTDHLKSL